MKFLVNGLKDVFLDFFINLELDFLYRVGLVDDNCKDIFTVQAFDYDLERIFTSFTSESHFQSVMVAQSVLSF